MHSQRRIIGAVVVAFVVVASAVASASIEQGATVTRTAERVGHAGPPAATAFSENFDGPQLVTGNRNGDLDERRFSVARWRTEMSTNGTQNVTHGPVPPDDVRIEAGVVVLDVGSQNFGDTVVRLNQPFDIAGRTGTVVFDTVLHRPGEGLAGLWGFPMFMFLSEPYSAPSYQGDNNIGPTPLSGVVIHFPWSCGTDPMVRIYRDGAETEDRSAFGDGVCNVLPTTAPDAMNRVRLRVSRSAMQVCVSDHDDLRRFARCWNFALDLDFTRGWLSFGGHNHASVKYDGGPIWTTKWDNISFDGPRVPASRVHQVNNGPGRQIGHPLPAAGDPVRLTVRDVDLSGATSAHIVLSSRADEITNSDHDAWRLNYAINDGPTRSVPFRQNASGGQPAGHVFSFSVPLADLRNGTNTLSFSGTGMQAGYSPYIGNVDLVLQ